MVQQTAVEWLYNHLFPKQLDGFSDEEWGKIDKAFEQAKSMEKGQIMDAYDQGESDGYKQLVINIDKRYESFDQYYNETYGK